MKLLLLIPLLALVAAAPPQQGSDEQFIVVTGTPLSKTERALRECLQRHCPPDQDIDATLAHAENLFVAGDYKGARRVTNASIGRNHGKAGQYPVPVSDLYRANSRIAAHLGESENYEQSTWGIKRALKSGLPKTDPRLIAADMEVAAMQAALGRIDTARAMYRDAARDATSINRRDLAAMARLRDAWLFELTGDRRFSVPKLREIAGDRDPAARTARLTALVLLARFDRQAGKQESSVALLSELKGAGFTKPVLVFAPPIDVPLRPGWDEGGSTTNRMATENFEDRWVDVGFFVTPQGRVAEAEILRSSGPTYWAAPVLKSISGRIYSPSAGDNLDGAYRVERYTYTSRWTDQTGTRLRVRSPQARIEYLDLTPDG